MPPVYCLVKDVTAKRTDWALKLRLVRAYDIPMFGDRERVSSFECVFRDAEGGTIRGSARNPHMEGAKEKLAEGNLYIIANFMVSKDELRYKTATHTHKFSFYGKTKIRQIQEPSFPENRFHFKSFDWIHALKEGDESLLFDVIGLLVGMQEPKTLQTSNGAKRLMEIEIEDTSNKKLTIALWEEFIDKVMPFYNTGSENAVVIVMQFCRPKVFNATVKVSNTYHCTKLFVNDDVWEINEYRRMLEGTRVAIKPVTSLSAASSSRGSATSEFESGKAVVRNLQELCEDGEDGFYWVYCSVAEVENATDMWYMACLSCHRKLNKVGKKYNCRHCGDVEENNNYRYKIEIRVIDETYNALFLVWDTEGIEIFKRTAHNLKTEEDNSPGVLDGVIARLVDQNILFKVSKRTDPQRRSRSSFSVVKLCNDPEILERFKTSYVQSQESDLISKLCKKMKEGDEASSDDEVSTPEKKDKFSVTFLGNGDDEVKLQDKGKGKEIDDELKVKRKLDDQFSSTFVPKNRVVVKEEKP